MERIVARSLMARPGMIRSIILPASRATIPRRLHTSQARYSDQLPTVFSREFWANLVPKPFRSTTAPGEKPKPKVKSKEWNPATFFIFIFLLIGSMSINQIILRTEYEAFMERADAKIGVLREVVEKLQKGEDVDVEKALGTGDPVKEQEWKDLLEVLQDEDAMRSSRKKEQAKQAAEPPKHAPEMTKTTSTAATKPKVTAYDFY